jgi:AcrR family transcriptional regulator
VEEQFRRARRPGQKEQRREAILDVARRLADRSGVAWVSLGNIATEVGLAKSNVLRYFGTREEIYLCLTMREGTEWAQAATVALQRAHGPGAAAAALADAFVDRPLYCDLTTHADTMFEHNVTVDVLRTYKRWAIDMYMTVGGHIAVACPPMTVEDGAAMVMASAAFVAKLFPQTRPAEALRELFRQEPEIARTFPPLRPTLTHMLTATATGLAASPRLAR